MSHPPPAARGDPLAWVSRADMGLLTDLYQLTMADSYFRQGLNAPASFSLFARRLPPRRGFLLAAGLATALAYLEELRFGPEAIAWLRARGGLSDAFLDYLADFRFTGEVWALPEGQVCFPPAPLLEVTAPLIEAQIVETFLLNVLNSQTMWATKAARIVLAAGGRGVVDFSPRRDHGADAAMKVARASYIAGALGSSNVLAGLRYGLPTFGTMAHSYVMRFAREIDAFRAYARDFPDATVLLLDTYDTLRAADLAVTVGRELAAAGHALRAVRLDSGDLAALSRGVRARLDAGGLAAVRIMASGDLDEQRIAALLAGGAPIDLFGVGTALGTSEDAPALGGVYKLVAEAGAPRIKLSPGKVTLPGPKQVWRVHDAAGRLHYDLLARRDEPGPGEGLAASALPLAALTRGEGLGAALAAARAAPRTPLPAGARPLLERVMRGGRAEIDLLDLEAPRARARASLAALPEACRALEGGAEPPIRLSAGLVDVLADLLANRVAEAEHLA